MKKVINILVSLVFLTSFVGVQIHKHYSNGRLYSTAIFAEAEPCCEDMEHCEMANMSSHQCETQMEDDCSCKDETQILKLNQIFLVSEKQDISETPVFDIISNCCVINNLHNNYPKLFNQFIDISPPLVETDFQAEFGVFLC